VQGKMVGGSLTEAGTVAQVKAPKDTAPSE
jgi:hypothetical protein